MSNPPMRYPDLPDELVADEQKAFTDFFDCVYDNNHWHMNPEFKSGAWYAWQSRAVIANKRIAAHDEKLAKQEPDGWLAYTVEAGQEVFEFSSDNQDLVKEFINDRVQDQIDDGLEPETYHIRPIYFNAAPLPPEGSKP